MAAPRMQATLWRCSMMAPLLRRSVEEEAPRQCRRRALSSASASAAAAAASAVPTSPSSSSHPPPPLTVAPGPQAPERLRPGEVHVWWLRPALVPDEAVAACERRILSEEERRAGGGGGASSGGSSGGAPSTTTPALWRERVLTRALVRCALARYLPWAQADAAAAAAAARGRGPPAKPPPPPPLDPAHLRFARNAHGKPHLLLHLQPAPPPPPSPSSPSSDTPHTPPPAPPPPLEFNVTHTPDLIGVAVCLAGPVHSGGGGGGGSGSRRGDGEDEGGGARERGVAVALGLDAELAARRGRQREGGRRRGERRREQGDGSNSGSGSSSSSSSSSDGGGGRGGLTQAGEEEQEQEQDEQAEAETGGEVEGDDDDDDGFRRLAARRLHPLEVRRLEEEAARRAGAVAGAGAGLPAAGAAARAALFVRLWTLKEAVVKARGVGISHPPGLKGFSIEEAEEVEEGERGRPHGADAAAASEDEGDGIAAHLARLTGGLGPCGGRRVSRLSLRWHPPAAAALPSTATSPTLPVLPTDDSFKLLLLRPSPGHVAALCVHALPPDGGGSAGSPRGSGGDGPRVAGAVRRVVSRHALARGAAASPRGGEGGEQQQQQWQQQDDDAAAAGEACVLAGTRWW